MTKYICCYYALARGSKPVEEFIDSLDKSLQRKFYARTKLLEQNGHRLTRPFAEHVEDKIYALRFRKSKLVIRVLYFFFDRNKIMFTNGFKKKTRRMPKGEIELAKRRRQSFLNREK